MSHKIKYGHIEKNWLRLFIQGLILVSLGVVFALSSIFNTDAIVMSARGFSWLPVSGIIIFGLGIQQCLEAFFSKQAQDFQHNIQVGILDVVIGALIFLNVSESPEQLTMMIAAFLMVRGIVRVILVHTLNLPQKLFTSILGAISIFLGGIIGLNFYHYQVDFLSFCLNLEIAFRGWSMMVFAWWVKQHNIKPHIKNTDKTR